MRGCALKTSGDTFVTGPSIRCDGDLILSHLRTCTLTIVTAPPGRDHEGHETLGGHCIGYNVCHENTATPPFPPPPHNLLIEAGGCTVSLRPHSTLSHSALIVQLGSKPGDVTRGRGRGCDAAVFLQTASTVPGARLHLEKPNRNQWGGQTHQSYTCPCVHCAAHYVTTAKTFRQRSQPGVQQQLFWGWQCLRLAWEGPVYSNYWQDFFFLPQWHCLMFLWLSGLCVRVPFSICLTKLTGITGILCIPPQRHKAGDADNACANVWLAGPANSECSLSLGLHILSKWHWWGCSLAHSCFWLVWINSAFNGLFMFVINGTRQTKKTIKQNKSKLFLDIEATWTFIASIN